MWRMTLQEKCVHIRTQTDPLSTKNHGSQCKKSKDEGIQVDGPKEEKSGDGEYEDNEDEIVLEKYVTEMSQVMFDEVQKMQVSTFTDEEPESWTILHKMRRGSLEDTEGLAVTALAWNATGSQLIASYGRVDTYGWCSNRGSLCCWNLFSSSNDSSGEPDFRMEVASGVQCIQAHPSQPAMIIGGTFNGEVMVWNTANSNDEDLLVASSPITEYCHQEPISSIQWIPDASKAGMYLIASLSRDGKLNIWNLDNQLATPIRCLLLHDRKHVIGGLCLAFNNLGNFVVGSEGGAVCRGTLGKFVESVGQFKLKWKPDAIQLVSQIKDPTACIRAAERQATKQDLREVTAALVFETCKEQLRVNGVKFNYQPHSGPSTAVHCSPFHRNIFLSCGTDGALRLYSLLEREPVASVFPSTSNPFLNHAEWSPHRPSVCGTCSNDGKLFLYDFCSSGSVPNCVMEFGEQLQTFRFNHRIRGVIATGDLEGNIHVIKLGWRLSNRQPDDLSALERLVYSSK